MASSSLGALLYGPQDLRVVRRVQGSGTQPR
jgi:hypothetical protein